MKLTLESTDLIVPFGGVATRRWIGVTEGGVKVAACIALIAVRAEADCAALERELIEIRRPDVPLDGAAIRAMGEPL